MNKGIKVTIWFEDRVTVLHNVTEIHWNYRRRLAREGRMVAFESVIHSTGCNYRCAEILEFVTAPETEIAHTHVQERPLDSD